MIEVSEWIPDWVSRPSDEIQACWLALDSGNSRRRLEPREDGVYQVLAWLTIGERSPITARSGGQTSREHARGESWAGLCVAAGMPTPTELDWSRLGVEPRPAVTDDREFAYGAWRCLSWLLGVREDWPAHTSWHSAAAIPPECPHFGARGAERDTAAWRAADAASRERAQAEAALHWRHIRERADATAAAR